MTDDLENLKRNLESLQRFGRALNDFDERASMIISLHAALDRELGHVLERLVDAPEHLRRLGFGHKVDVVHALVGEAFDYPARVLIAFNELRNSVGHADPSPKVSSLQDKVFEAFDSHPEIAEAGPVGDIRGVAAGMFGFMNGLGK